MSRTTHWALHLEVDLHGWRLHHGQKKPGTKPGSSSICAVSLGRLRGFIRAHCIYGART